jgi:hypothetical protein
MFRPCSVSLRDKVAEFPVSPKSIMEEVAEISSRALGLVSSIALQWSSGTLRLALSDGPSGGRRRDWLASDHPTGKATASCDRGLRAVSRVPFLPTHPSRDPIEQRVDRWIIAPRFDNVAGLLDVLPCLSDRACQLDVAHPRAPPSSPTLRGGGPSVEKSRGGLARRRARSL